MKDRKRIEELLNACISYIDSHIESYSDMIDTFKELGFTDDELIEFNIRDYVFEKEFNYEF